MDWKKELCEHYAGKCGILPDDGGEPRVRLVADNVNHPSHYETGKFECFDVMLEALGEEVVKGFCIGNAFKYIYRHRRKNGVEDIKKAIWYLNKVVGLEEGDQK